MKLLKHTSMLAVLFGSALFAHTASAYLQLTYISDPLTFKQGYLGGEPDDTIGSDNPPYPFFSVAFSNTNGDSGTQSLTGAALVNISEWPYQLGNTSASGASITLGENGIPNAWNFSLEITKSSPGYSIGEDTPLDKFQLPSRTTWWLESSHGTNTCNCDWFKYEDDLYIERPYNSWAYANTVAALFGDANSESNWTISKVNVPEPRTYLLFLLGIMAIGVTRARNRKMV